MKNVLFRLPSAFQKCACLSSLITKLETQGVDSVTGVTIGRGSSRSSSSLRAVLRAIGTFRGGWITSFTTGATSRRYGSFLCPQKHLHTNATIGPLLKGHSSDCHLLRGYSQIGRGWGPFGGSSRFQEAVCRSSRTKTVIDTIYRSCGYVAQQCNGQPVLLWSDCTVTALWLFYLSLLGPDNLWVLQQMWRYKTRRYLIEI